MKVFYFFKRNTILTFSLLVCLLIAKFSASSLFALPTKPFLWQMGLGTAMIFYGDDDIVAQRETNFPKNSTRVILNGEVGSVLMLNEIVALDFSTKLGLDSFSKNGNSMFILNYDFNFGFRIFPGINFFCFGIDYIYGGYTNWLKTDGEKDKSAGDWSNGFRILAEFNILQNREGWSPAVGFYWQNMPLNGGFNNIIGIYVKAQHR